MSHTPRFLPTAMLFADGNAILTSETITTGTKTVMADTIARINVAITEVNTYYWLYGYSASPAIPAVPTVAAATSSNALANGIFYQSANADDAGLSVELADRTMSEGFTRPQSALDAILTEPNLSNIKLARSNLDSGKS